ncbi:molybdopterin converting factor, subunit 1 [Rubrobacter xylanophilus DSM 9941]|uniref:Molybdopterin synthase sulfur carrier subunit n=1 Tax=Rubrobacter xylanophilus (strain DSM 9941 / JCM 11954 / NBRC 16129 / PRD-1) TaxID=266117 RepID=Q1AT09_RUBXD|nr:molybdopterin converting factor subunit 1 [Rubrobacter xylanophilus]ABG05469.1 molybdopterin converting factor, subunit 1 [Rubrobacter xylanophilus DSM 9941]
MQKVRVLFFGAAADRAGAREVELPAEEGATLGELWASLSRRHPGLSPMRESLAFAVNGEYASEERPVRPGDEVAVLPPVSGG